jgi:hypothetical protein
VERYSVEMTKLPWVEIGKSPVIFHVRQGQENLGTLRVKKGHIVWVPEKAAQGFWLDWTKFGRVMAKNGRKRPAGL